MLRSSVCFLVIEVFLLLLKPASSGCLQSETYLGSFHAGLTTRCEYASQNQNYPEAKVYKYDKYILYDRVVNATINEVLPPTKYYLSIMSMFKNEAGIMKEWLDHHIGHGVDHFYLVNDGSDDNYYEVLKPYIENRLITMCPAPKKNMKFRQVAAYNRVLQRIMIQNESHWVAFIDFDEFLWSPRDVDIRKILRANEVLSIIGLNWAWYGSSGLLEQPENVIQSFTRRADYDYSKYPKLTEIYKILKFTSQKNIINTQRKVVEVQIHTAEVEGLVDNLSLWRYPDNPPLVLNHYSVQAKNFFVSNKGTRGSANGFYATNDRNLDWFTVCDINDVLDESLAKQNQLGKIAISCKGDCADVKKPVVSTEQKPTAIVDSALVAEVPDTLSALQKVSSHTPSQSPTSSEIVPEKRNETKKEFQVKGIRVFKEGSTISIIDTAPHDKSKAKVIASFPICGGSRCEGEENSVGEREESEELVWAAACKVAEYIGNSDLSW